ncbi:MAG TPA: SGNH/GDSL hydrolase family protein [Terriglobia bacterium]|nr:SGNH/GDSL hydrolase family protein [Terriglobia bacterium]
MPLYEDYIEADTGVSVSLLNLGIPGWTSGDLRNATSSGPLFRLSIYFSRVVTWNIGGNDLNAARSSYKAGTCGGADNQDCLRAAVATFKTNWNGILRDLLTLRHGRATVMRTMTIYNPFVSEDMASGDFLTLKAYLDEVNNHIRYTSALVGVKVARVDVAFNGIGGDEDAIAKGLIAFDGFHPNAKGHLVTAQLLRAQGYSSIVP